MPPLLSLPRKRRCALRSWAGLFVVAALSGVGVQAATAQPAEPTPPPASPSRYVDPAGIPPRPPVRDIEPVFRGPAVDTLATIRQRGVLRVGVSAVAPMVMRGDNGALSGFSIDVANRLAEDLGVRAEFFETSWSQIVADLLDRQFDVIVSGLWVTPERALVVNFTQPTSSEGIYMVANKALAAGLGSVSAYDAPGVRIAVMPGTMQAAVAARRFPRATIVAVDGDTANDIALVVSGKAHAALVPTFAPAALVAQAGDVLVLPTPDPLQRTHTAMAVRKGDPDFLNTLDSWLTYQRGAGWLDERAAHWAAAAASLK